MNYESGRLFGKQDFLNKQFPSGEYEDCQFQSCDLENFKLDGSVFIDCRFTDCNMSLAKVQQTAFRNVVFENCRMMGLMFHDCNKLGLELNFKGSC
jgi:uncharacterized protein YjbI with pentapeptide repeats